MLLILLSLALLPLLAPNFWNKSEKKFLSGIAIISTIITYFYIKNANEIMEHILIRDYIPFIIMLFTLYVMSNGIDIKIETTPSTLNNIIFLGISSVFSSLIGTTGASMLLLKPFININKERKIKTHLIIFFIFMVSNIGGLLTPLGDPPLLLGYLNGIDFFWCLKNLGGMWLFYIATCLSILAIIDHLIISKEKNTIKNIPFKIKIDGILNITLVLITVITLSSNINICLKNSMLLSFCVFSLTKFRKPKMTENTLKKITALLILVFIFLFTRKLLKINFIGIDLILLSSIAIMFIKKNHNHNDSAKIDLEPFKEVAITFFVIFIVMAPVNFLLNQFSDNIQKYIMEMGNPNNYGATVYFWLCGIASSFLDNAPSYLLFFNIAGGNSHELMSTHTDILKAISTGSVVMGAMTYIGNAPNMMVKSVATKYKIGMPSFIAYIGWSIIIILPLSLIASIVLL